MRVHYPCASAEIEKWVGTRIKPMPIAEATRDQAIMQINTFLTVSGAAVGYE